MTTINLGTSMVRLRVIAEAEKDDARLLAGRKARREELLEEARKNPKPPCFIVTWFRNRSTIAET